MHKLISSFMIALFLASNIFLINPGASQNTAMLAKSDQTVRAQPALIGEDPAENGDYSLAQFGDASICSTVTQIPQSECEALVAFYIATDGENWQIHTDWLTTDDSPCYWYGVTCTTGSVTGIDVQLNDLSGSIPTVLGNLPNLTSLNLGANQLTGSIPAVLGSLTKLTFLAIDENLITGNIPEEFGNLTNLTILNLGGNQLTGSIPSELGNLTNLTTLYLHDNQLSGSIPIGFINLINLENLYLNQNQLTGSIPIELGNLTNLSELRLNVNQFTGSLPLELTNLTNMRLFYYGGTNICTPLDAGMQAWLDGITFTQRSGIVCSATNTPTVLPTSTFTPIPTNTFTPTPTNTFTPIPTNTFTPIPTNTFTPTPTNTFTPTPTNTFTPIPTNTFTPIPTNTFTPTPTETFTATLTPTITPTQIVEIPGGFNKSSPANTLTNRSGSVTLKWGASQGATEYYYCFNTTKDGKCTTWVSNSTATKKTLSGLANNTTYYWQVKAVNTAGTTFANGSDTAFWSFKTGTPAAFKKASPFIASINQSVTPTLKWAASKGAIAYYYCFDATNDDKCTTWVNNGTATSKILSGLAANTTYYWQVRAVNSFGTVYANGTSTAFWWFKTGILPKAFKKTSPTNGLTNQQGSVSLKWAVSNGATSYWYCYDTSNDSICTNWVNNGTATSSTLTGLEVNTIYYWQVRAENAIGNTYANGSSTAFWYFKTELPGEFVKASPVNGASGQPASLTLSWTPSKGVVAYYYCYDDSNDNTCTNWFSNGIATSKTITGLVDGQTYYWHVYAMNSWGNTYSDASSTAFWSFSR